MDNSVQYFLSSLSHEIRTPLNGIVGYTQLLNQTKLDSTQKSYTNSMNQCCLQLVQLINDILDFSKLTTSNMQINNESFTIKELVEEVDMTLKYRIKEKRQTCNYNLDRNLPEYVISDKSKIIQILINLITNANKFTDIGGEINVDISLALNSMIQFSVRDNGIGIEKKHINRLFDVFYQVQESVTKNGSGLGLAICKKLVELLEGSIQVKSEKGKGSTFKFTVKYEHYEKFEKQILKDSVCLKNKYILIADNNVDSRLLLGEILFENNMMPIICSSIKETIRMIDNKRYPFDIVLIDVCMPATDLAMQIKQINSDIPLIALSSDEPVNMKYFVSVLQKPVNKVKLLDCLIKVINRDNIDDCIIGEKKVKKEPEKRIEKEKIHILIAEDVSYNLNMLIKMLESMGYRDIDTAMDGEQAIFKIDREYNKGTPYDILLLDLKMPVKNGIEVAEYIREKEYVFPKIAVLSASILVEDRERCKDLGIEYFVLKPINIEHLKKVLNLLIAGFEPKINIT